MRKQTKLVAVLSAAALLAIGASMTSFAATRGWVQEGEDWVYLDSNGERVYNQWKRSGDFYYYLGEDGLMLKDQLIHDDTVDAYYYVDENGVKIMNNWKSIPNEEGEQVGDNVPDVLYYYFGATGKAERSNDAKLKVKLINSKYYGFDSEGRMASGWQEVEDDLYYFGTELEGWAYTGWQLLEPGENMRDDDYDDLEWFYFGSNGKATKDKSKYINGKYYAFDSEGIMLDDWYGELSAPPTAASAAIAYASSSGTLSSGWVYTTAMDDPDGDEYWFYLVTIRDGNKVKRSIPYNYFDEDAPIELGAPGVRAKVIKNKTYIFNTDGKMMDGFVVINNPSDNGEQVSDEIKASADDNQYFENFVAGMYGTHDGNVTNGIKGRGLENGLYYFNETDGSVNGQLMTGRTAVTKDGETFYYYFNKSGNQNSADDYGKALTSSVKDGYLYGKDGRCVTADDGNSYAAYKVSDVSSLVDPEDGTDKVNGIKLVGKTGVASVITDEAPEGMSDAFVIVSRSGRIKQNGTATIDGIRYKLDGYKVTNMDVID